MSTSLSIIPVAVVVGGQASTGTRHRNLLQLGWCAAGTKGLEAVTEQKGDTTNAYYQVVQAGKEVLHTISLEEARQHYDTLK